MTIFRTLKYDFKNDLSSLGRTLEHREIILNKAFLRKLYEEWYHMILLEASNLPPGKIIELGAGGGFIKELKPDIITSDIIEFPWTDMTLSATDMPFMDSEISGLLMVDTFHHIPDSEKFLLSAQRVLKYGGKIIMVEPANSLWGRYIYKNYHHEPFDINGGWTISQAGPLTEANGALPWIVFERDKDKFAELFPELVIKSICYHTPLRYLLSGGVSYRQLVPSFSFGVFRLLDRLLSSLSSNFSMFVTIVIEKSKSVK